MKLRNKKTGEIGYPYFQNWKEITCVIVDENAIQIAEYTSLAELNEEWEDCEEVKIHWHIGCEGDVFIDITEECLKSYSSIGNDFETEEEAEKAVEKLKAWKRLKDNRFKFKAYQLQELNIKFWLDHGYTEMGDDLDLLFGGEDE